MSEPVFRDFVAGRDDPAVAELWQRSFGRASGGQTVEWLFRAGPAGPCPRSVAELDGRLVAHAGVSVARFRLSGREGVGGYSVGAMTDPDVRGRGLFVRTAEHLYARLAREGFAFVAGFSNANSEALHTGRLGRT
ncbi:MAG: GNAT family N-acetyltransferase, partial [Myxococcales bacterium]|nr:GNAT family N-acetyltransferase [Myxococcales bacterium]